MIHHDLQLVYIFGLLHYVFFHCMPTYCLFTEMGKSRFYENYLTFKVVFPKTVRFWES
jgi:hypothetical protein